LHGQHGWLLYGCWQQRCVYGCCDAAPKPLRCRYHSDEALQSSSRDVARRLSAVVVDVEVRFYFT
jgi:hypothetical protein